MHSNQSDPRAGEIEVEWVEATAERRKMTMKWANLIGCISLIVSLAIFLTVLCQECAHCKGEAEHAGVMFTEVITIGRKILPRRWLV